MTHQQHVPVVYGEPARIELLLDSITRLVEREPAEVFADAGVERSVRRLSRVAARRLADASAAPAEPPPG